MILQEFGYGGGIFPLPGRARARRALAVAAAVSLATLATLTAAACSSSSSSSASAGSSASASSSGTSSANQTSVTGVTLHIGDHASTGAQAQLTAAGLIGKLPFKAAWSDFTSGPPMLQAMGAGAVDVGGVGNAPPVFAAAGGDKIAIVGAYQANPLGSALLVPKNSPITSVAQLRGKRIAVAQGSSADYHLLTVLTKAGLTVHDVTLTYLQPAEGLAALSSGPWASVWAKASGTAGQRHAEGGQRRRVGRGAHHARGDQLRAAGLRRVHRGRLIPVHVNFSDYVDTSFNDTAETS